MGTIAQETAFQIALRNCSEEVAGKVSILGADITMKDFSAFLDMRRCKNWAQNLLLQISNYLKACSASFSQSTEYLIPDLHPKLLSGGVEGQRSQQLVI